MADRVPYDDFADIYDVWCESAPITFENRPFYVELLCEPAGPVVELGVGNGRICIDVARRGKRIYGVDSSEHILKLTRSRAEEAGVSDRLVLISGDFRDFRLPEPAELVTIPFHAIGHLLTWEDKTAALQNIRRQLLPGGRLVFDHFVFDPDFPREPGVPHLRIEFKDRVSGKEHLLWETASRDLSRQIIHLVVCTEELDENGVVLRRRYRRADLSWLEPDQSRSLLEKTGYEIEAVYGDFHRTPFNDSSREQIWVAQRPR